MSSNDDILAGYTPIGVTFSNTWKERGYVPDMATKNKSFTRMCAVYKKMGIRNYLWPLALRDQSLVGVDPWDPNLTNEQKVRIAVECKLNFIYFFREVVRVPSAGGDTIPFIANRANLALLFCFALSVAMGIVIPRQNGKTITISTVLAYLMFVLADKISIGMFTKDTTLIQDNTARLKEIRTDGMPKWMISLTSKDTDNKEGISYAAKGNFYKTYVAANDERSASKLGRGNTLSCEVFDEFAYFKHNHITVPTAVMAMNAAAPAVRRRGIPATLIYATTAGNPDTPEGAYALRTFTSAMPFTEHLFDLENYNSFLDLLDKSSINRTVYIEYSYTQLGHSEEWFKRVAAQSNGSADDIARDLLNIWQSASNNGVISPELRIKLRNALADPSWIDTSHGFLMRWYLPEDVVTSLAFKNKPLIAGMDTSENVGRDFTTLVILDPSDMSVVAVCRCNDSNSMQVARYVSELLLTYTNLVWIPERNNTGVAIIDFVMEQLQDKNINPYFRIYNEVVQNKDEPKFQDINVYDYKNIYGNLRAYFGYRTSGGGLSGTSRNMLYKSVMRKTLELNHSRVKDTTLISEFCNLTVRNGRVDHSSGMHDDTVIAYLLACFLVFHGKNLKLYGIPEGIVLSELSTSGDKVSAKDRNEQIAIRSRIAELENLIAGASSYHLIQSYKRELALLTPLVNKEMWDTSTPVAITQVKHEQKTMQNLVNNGDNRVRNSINQLANAFAKPGYSQHPAQRAMWNNPFTNRRM